MKAILHIGMPKTGTSSIQQTFHVAENLGPLRYFDWKQANHGSLIAAITHDQEHPFVIRQDADAVTRLNAETADNFRRAIDKEPAEAFIVSAERLFNRSEVKNVETVRAYFEQFASEFRVIAYVREPVSYMVSAFQQNVKTGLDKLNLKPIMPRYRKAISSYDQVFGAENVELRLFDRNALHQGDVVLDFAKAIGANITPDQVVRDNESMCIEAVSLAFFERRFGEGYNPKKDLSGGPKNQRFIGNLSRMKGQKFAFDPALYEALLQENAEEIAWVENRMGQPFPPAKSGSGLTISSVRDLIQLAEASQSQLRDHIHQTLGQTEVETPRDVTQFALAVAESLAKR